MGDFHPQTPSRTPLTSPSYILDPPLVQVCTHPVALYAYKQAAGGVLLVNLRAISADPEVQIVGKLFTVWVRLVSLHTTSTDT